MASDRTGAGDNPLRKMEILAPAGDEEMLRAAVFSGADCVYVGISGFNARHGAANFSGENLARAVAFCHARGCKVYAAINTLVLPGREMDLQAAVLQAAGAGCDAVIAQDLYTAEVVKAVRPQMALHASTQMSVHSLAGVEQLAKMGFVRVVLSRELSVDEIAAIAAATPIELEVFVHGALCVSVSGQCYASAFLGGRSANRGACAGTCRLPFDAVPKTMPQLADMQEKEQFFAGGRAASNCHLSLKDLSVLDALPQLQQMGVASAKIEGRLRGPEYCATAVDCARKALNNEKYDKQLLLSVFSRSGFTDGWFSGKSGGGMFGARRPEDADATRKALPKARGLYRRERPRVPVWMRIAADGTGALLTVTDGKYKAQAPMAGPFEIAADAGNGRERLGKALSKTGGTPFYLAQVPVMDIGSVHLPPALVNAARRTVLEELLVLREAPAPSAALPKEFSILPARTTAGCAAREQARNARETRGRMPLRARFERVEQIPDNADQICETLLVPLWEAEKVPLALRAKTVLWLPRVLFGPLEKAAATVIRQTSEWGFAGYEANNLGHLHLLEGLPITGGFGLNAANSAAVAILEGWGCQSLTLSLELSLAQMKALLAEKRVAQSPATDALCYGHMPLFLTRACPLQQVTDCARCHKAGFLADRKGQALPLLCRDGARTAYNPIPLWMAPELSTLPTDTATLYFTVESQRKAAQVLAAFDAGRPALGGFTRGLYPKGTRNQA